MKDTWQALALASIVGAGIARAASGQSAMTPPAPRPATKPCASPEHRQFDFWAGRWDVKEPDGKAAGTNEIRLLFDGCALQENWAGTDGSVGTSLNVYDASRKVWHQTWVDQRGGLLVLEGRFEGGKMVLRGITVKKDGPVENRITWQPLGGNVRQLWEASRDSGKTWSVVFDGTYVRR